jgi:hypothetical protein
MTSILGYIKRRSEPKIIPGTGVDAPAGANLPQKLPEEEFDEYDEEEDEYDDMDYDYFYFEPGYIGLVKMALRNLSIPCLLDAVDWLTRTAVLSCSIKVLTMTYNFQKKYRL